VDLVDLAWKYAQPAVGLEEGNSIRAAGLRRALPHPHRPRPGGRSPMAAASPASAAPEGTRPSFRWKRFDRPYPQGRARAQPSVSTMGAPAAARCTDSHPFRAAALVS
jgi:hypothetical protein